LTSVLVLAPVLLFGFTLVFFGRVAIKLLGRNAPGSIPGDDWATFSIDTYHPMQALFCDDDFAFLSSQPGFDFLLYKKLRRERLRIFRQYMNRLIADYNRLHGAARMLLATSSYDQSNMLGRLILLRLRFSGAVFHAELNYLLCCVGFRTLTVRAVLARVRELNEQVAALAAFRAI
jgi:hypothetical protein